VIRVGNSPSTGSQLRGRSTSPRLPRQPGRLSLCEKMAVAGNGNKSRLRRGPDRCPSRGRRQRRVAGHSEPPLTAGGAPPSSASRDRFGSFADPLRVRFLGARAPRIDGRAAAAGNGDFRKPGRPRFGRGRSRAASRTTVRVTHFQARPYTGPARQVTTWPVVRAFSLVIKPFVIGNQRVVLQIVASHDQLRRRPDRVRPAAAVKLSWVCSSWLAAIRFRLAPGAFVAIELLLGRRRGDALQLREQPGRWRACFCASTGSS